MEWRLGGLSRRDIEEGLAAIYACSSVGDLERAIEERAVLRAPIFHSAFRQEVASILRDTPEHSIGKCHEDFFFLLHRRAHEQFLRTAVEREVEPPAEVISFVPPYFRALIEGVAGQLPSQIEVPLRPDCDGAAIQTQVSALAVDFELPAYVVNPGALWSALVVTCPRCREDRLIVHAHLVDIAAAPEMKEHLIAGRINEHRCPRCGIEAIAPVFVWVQESPGASDVLNAAATLWYISDAAMVYVPPLGARRETANDRVLEERASLLQEELDLRWPAAGEQAGVRSVAIAYTNRELVSIWERIDSPGTMPFDMQALIWDIGAKLEAGLVAPAEIEEFLQTSLPAEARTWPIAVSPVTFDERPYVSLSRCLIMEATARVNGSSDFVRSLLAGETTSAYFGIGEVGLGEVALTRAMDRFHEVPPGADRDELETDSFEARAALLVKLGKHAQAAEFRAAVLARRTEPGTFLGRFNKHQIAASYALNLFRIGKFAEALEAFRAETAALEALAAEAESVDSELERGILPAIQNSLSGALANWSTLLGDLADYIEITEHLQALSPGDGEGQDAYVSEWDLPRASPEVRSRVAKLAREQRLTEIERILAMAGALPILGRYLDEEQIPVSTSGSDTVRKLARRMLEQALALSEAVGGWGFAAIQAHRLVTMMQKVGEHDAAERTMHKVLEFAARVNDHRRLVDAYAFFADQAGQRGDGSEALKHMRSAAREAMRAHVGFGHHAKDDGTLGPVGFVAIQCVRFGAPPLDAIVVAESLKDVSMAADLTRGVGFLAEEEGVPALARLRLLREEREQIQRRAIWDDVGEQLQALDAAIDEARHQASLRDPRYARWSDATAIEVPAPDAFLQRLQTLGENAAYIGFFKYGAQVWTYAVWPGGALVPSVQHWPFDDDEEGQPAASVAHLDPELLSVWSDVLLLPLRARLEELRPEDSLVISLHEGLEHIPFAALPIQGRRLIEWARISYVQGVGMFGACVERSTALGAAVCLGDPFRLDLDSLPAAAREAEDIAALFRASGRKADLFTGERATFRALREAAAQADVIHFACHAAPDERSPAGALPRLMLAADAQNNDSGELSDERILVDLRLKQGCFVNLAACSSASRRSSAGPLVKGLVPAFLVGGASAVLATLWRIEDTHAVRFNAAFYARLLAGQGLAASLAETQRACASGRLGEDMSDPAAWAGYKLFGTG